MGEVRLWWRWLLAGGLLSFCVALRCSAFFSSLSVALISFILLSSALLSIFSGSCNFFRMIGTAGMPRILSCFQDLTIV